MSRTQPSRSDLLGDARTDSYIRAFQRLVGEVFRLNGQLLMLGDSLSADMHMSTARWQVMATIRTEAATVAAISRSLGLRRQSVQATVNRLRADGMVTLQKNPRHSRASLVRLTRHGEEVIGILRERQIAAAELFMTELDLSIDDIHALTRQLRKAREAADSFAVPGSVQRHE